MPVLRSTHGAPLRPAMTREAEPDTSAPCPSLARRTRPELHGCSRTPSPQGRSELRIQGNDLHFPHAQRTVALPPGRKSRRAGQTCRSNARGEREAPSRPPHRTPGVYQRGASRPRDPSGSQRFCAPHASRALSPSSCRRYRRSELVVRDPMSQALPRSTRRAVAAAQNAPQSPRRSGPFASARGLQAGKSPA